jgi:hypothetical protein
MAAAMVHTTDNLSHVCAGRLFKDSEVPAQRLFMRLEFARWLIPMLFPTPCALSSPIMGSHLFWENTLPGLTRQKKVQSGQAFLISGDHNPD